MKNAFSTYHPLVNFAYFTLVLAFAMVFMNPICLLISLACAFVYSIGLKGKRAAIFNFGVLVPMLLFTALINPAFNHEGATILAYLPSDNPLTLESIAYGLAASAMLAAVICWFSCFNEVITSDKFVYLFGRIIPALSLILSMVLRFVPKFKTQIKIVSNAQRCIGRDVSSGSFFQRARHGITILSIMVTWALENAIETADSMKSRGYGLPGRTAFSIYRFDKRDRLAMLFIAFLGGTVVLAAVCGSLYFRYFPTMKGAPLTLVNVAVFVLYAAFCLIPFIIDRREARQWRATQSKI